MSEVIEEAVFLRTNHKPIFGILYSKQGMEHLNGCNAVVVCDSLFEEKLWSERVVANLARQLAIEGFAVITFDYFGYGNSLGDHEEVTVKSLLSDVEYVYSFLKAKGAIGVSVVGIRWGATLAYRFAIERESASQVFLVEPVVSWNEEIRKALRTNVGGQYAMFKKTVITRDEIIENLLNGKECVYSGYKMNNIDGYVISKDFMSESLDMELLSDPIKNTCDVTIFAISKNSGQVSRYRELQQKFVESGINCELEILTNVNPFWVNYREFTSTADELYSAITDRLKRVGNRIADESINESVEISVGGGEVRIGSCIKNEDVEEKIVTIGTKSGDRLYAVCYKPISAQEFNVGVVFTHGGLIGMNGAFRFNTRLARKFAKDGIPCLCFDPHGMGRSKALIKNIDQRVLFRKIQKGLFADDVREAVEFMAKECNLKRVVAFGVCGGAITSIIAHGKYNNINGSILLSIPVMYSGLSHETVRMSEGFAKFYLGLYLRKVFNPVAWLRFFTFKSDYKVIFKAINVTIFSVLSRFWNKLKSVLKVRSKTARQVDKKEREAVIKRTSAVTGSGLEFNDNFLKAYRSIISRGDPVLFVFGDNDNFKWEFFSEFVERFPEDWDAGKDSVRMEIIKHANHMYTLREWQDAIFTICLDWIRLANRDH